MEPKYVPLNPALYDYFSALRSDVNDPVLADLQQENSAFGEDSKMQISAEQGMFLSILVASIGAQSAIELGTFTGYSSICIARALPPGGRLLCIDANPRWTPIARRYWQRAGVAEKIDFRLGPALPILQELPPEIQFDFAFIDAAKVEYEQYYELILPRLRPNGLIAFDNMLWAGRLLQPDPEDVSARAILSLNQKLPLDPRIDSVLLTVADGIQLCRKR